MHVNNYFICLLAALFAFFTSCSQTVSAPKQNAEVSSENEDEEEQAGCEGESGEPWDGTTAKEFACGNGSKKDPYIILTAEQLARLSFLVGDGDEKYLGKYYKLGTDIILNKGSIVDSKGELSADSAKLHKWTPIGNSKVAFSGNFDGDGRSISGMFINTTSTHNGLFGNIKGTVQNLTVENGWVSGGSNTAGVIGELSTGGFVKNVHNKASVSGVGEGTAGVVGVKREDYHQEKVNIEQVSNSGIIKGEKYVGGIVGHAQNFLNVIEAVNESPIEGEYATGGIVGYAGFYIMIERSENRSNIYGREYTAGIVGFSGYSNSAKSGAYGVIDRSINLGAINGEKNTGGINGAACGVNVWTIANYGTITGTENVGGVIGYSKLSNVKGAINRSDVSALKNVGGILGKNQEGVLNATYSTGKVEGDTLVGLMIGYNFNTTMADYYYLKRGDQEPFGINDGGGVATPMTSKEMKTEEFAEMLGGDFAYDPEKDGGYPTLKWE